MGKQCWTALDVAGYSLVNLQFNLILGTLYVFLAFSCVLALPFTWNISMRHKPLNLSKVTGLSYECRNHHITWLLWKGDYCVTNFFFDPWTKFWVNSSFGVGWDCQRKLLKSHREWTRFRFFALLIQVIWMVCVVYSRVEHDMVFGVEVKFYRCSNFINTTGLTQLQNVKHLLKVK